MTLELGSAASVRRYPHDIRRERQMMPAFQNPVLGPLLRVYVAMIQPGRRDNFQSLLSSLNIMLESREGYESSTGACAELLRAGVSPKSGCAT
jgi:hypothetical protein